MPNDISNNQENETSKDIIEERRAINPYKEIGFGENVYQSKIDDIKKNSFFESTSLSLNNCTYNFKEKTINKMNNSELSNEINR